MYSLIFGALIAVKNTLWTTISENSREFRKFRKFALRIYPEQNLISNKVNWTNDDKAIKTYFIAIFLHYEIF